MPKGAKPKSKSQADKFREAARKHETGDSEEAFDRALKRVAKAGGTGPKDKRAKPSQVLMGKSVLGD